MISFVAVFGFCMVTAFASYPRTSGYPYYSRYKKPQLLPKYAHLQDKLPFSIARLSGVPDYTTLVKDFEEGTHELWKHISKPVGAETYGVPENDSVIQYISVVHAVNQLISGLVNHTPYHMLYIPTVENSLIETESDPLSVARSVRSRLKRTISQTALIRDFIKEQQQSVCPDPYSHECNLIIHNALQRSNDPLLREQAKFLTALTPVLKLYKNAFAPEIAEVAKTNRAQSYLLNGARRFQPLVIAGAEARQLGLSVRTSGS